MIRFFGILFFVLAYAFGSLINCYAQDLVIPSGWKEVSVCEIKFVMPIDLKKQNSKGIDSCVADFKGSKMRIGIDYGSHGNTYKNNGTKLDFKEEIIEIDGKKSQMVIYGNGRNNRKMTAGLYVFIHEAHDGTKTSLNMTAEVESEKELETAKQIFRSILFVKTVSFFGGFIDVFGNYKGSFSAGPDFHVEYISLDEPDSGEKAFLGIYNGNNPNFNPPKNAKIKRAKFRKRVIKWHIWSEQKGKEFYYYYEAVILDNNGIPTNHLFIGGTNKRRVEALVKAVDTYRTIQN